jgi:hypothetical protein
MTMPTLQPARKFHVPVVLAAALDEERHGRVAAVDFGDESNVFGSQNTACKLR